MHTLIHTPRAMNRHSGEMGITYLAPGTKERQTKKEGIAGILWMRSKLFPCHWCCAATSKGSTSLTSEGGSMPLAPVRSVPQPLGSTTATMRLLIQYRGSFAKTPELTKVQKSLPSIFQIQCQVRERPHSCVTV